MFFVCTFCYVYVWTDRSWIYHERQIRHRNFNFTYCERLTCSLYLYMQSMQQIRSNSLVIFIKNFSTVFQINFSTTFELCNFSMSKSYFKYYVSELSMISDLKSTLYKFYLYLRNTRMASFQNILLARLG